MDKLTLAEHIDEKLRQELLDDHEFKYVKNDWFIAMILRLLKDYKDILPNTLSTKTCPFIIMEEIESYFQRKQQKRELKQQLLRSFFYNHGQYRSMEDLILLLLIGYSFLNAFRRLCNAQKEEGQLLELEPDEYNNFKLWAYPETLPKQIKSAKVDKLIAMIKDENVPEIAISTSLNHISSNKKYKI